MDPFYKAISLFRRKRYEDCINICNELLQANPRLKGPWELKMRAMTQRVYVDDIEADDGVPGKSFNIFNNFRLNRNKKQNKKDTKMIYTIFL